MGSFGLCDQRLLGHDFRDEFVDVGLRGEIEEVDAFGLNFAVAADVLERDAGWVVPD